MFLHYLQDAFFTMYREFAPDASVWREKNSLEFEILNRK